jgi:hypothetical protein
MQLQNQLSEIQRINIFIGLFIASTYVLELKLYECRCGVRRHPHFHSYLNYLIAEKRNEKDLYRFQTIRDCFCILLLRQSSILL